MAYASRKTWYFYLLTNSDIMKEVTQWRRNSLEYFCFEIKIFLLTLLLSGMYLQNLRCRFLFSFYIFLSSVAGCRCKGTILYCSSFSLIQFVFPILIECLLFFFSTCFRPRTLHKWGYHFYHYLSFSFFFHLIFFFGLPKQKHTHLHTNT